MLPANEQDSFLDQRNPLSFSYLSHGAPSSHTRLSVHCTCGPSSAHAHSLQCGSDCSPDAARGPRGPRSSVQEAGIQWKLLLGILCPNPAQASSWLQGQEYNTSKRKSPFFGDFRNSGFYSTFMVFLMLCFNLGGEGEVVSSGQYCLCSPYCTNPNLPL